MIHILIVLLTFSGSLLAAPALKSDASVSVSNNSSTLTTGKLSKAARKYIRQSHKILNANFPFDPTGVEATYETFENVTYDRALAFLNLTVDTQIELKQRFSTVLEASGVDFTALLRVLHENGVDVMWLMDAAENFTLANSTKEYVAYVKEQRPELGSLLETFRNSTLDTYNTVSNEGQQFLTKAYQSFWTGMQIDTSSEETEEDEDDDEFDFEPQYRTIHKMFMDLSVETREEVLRKMTAFLRPKLQVKFVELMERWRKE